MDIVLLVVHNILRWGILICAVWTLINAFSGTFGNRPYTRGDNTSSLLFMTLFDLQLLIGLIQLYRNGWFAKFADMGALMKSTVDRFFVIEHALMMIIAWILVHVGRTKVKRALTDKAKHKKMLIFFGIAILLILISVPWPFRNPEIARPWFRWLN